MKYCQECFEQLFPMAWNYRQGQGKKQKTGKPEPPSPPPPKKKSHKASAVTQLLYARSFFCRMTYTQKRTHTMTPALHTLSEIITLVRNCIGQQVRVAPLQNEISPKSG